MRCRLTLTLALLNILFFAFSCDSQLRLQSDIALGYAFSIPAIESGNFKGLIFSPFLHWGLRHLVMNLLTLTLFAGGLRYLAGTSFVALAYFIPAFFANLVTTVIFFLPMRWIYPPWWEVFRANSDVGASLGIFGCAGALTVFFRKAPLLARRTGRGNV